MTYDEIGDRIKAEYDGICKSCGGEDCVCCEIYSISWQQQTVQ